MICRKKKRKRLLVLLDDIPSEEHPYSWIHAWNQVVKLSEDCEINVVAPVCLAVSFTGWKEIKMQLKKLPKYKYKMEGITCWRPRYLDFTLIPWKYRKHYFQIWTAILSLLFLIFRQRVRFDIIHAHFVYRPGYVAAILGKILKKPVVITAHGSDIHRNLFQDGRDIFRKRTVCALKRSSSIIAVSKYLMSWISKYGFGHKTSVIPCGFFEDRFYPVDKNESRLKLALHANNRIILFVGDLKFVKGVDLLIGAFEILLNRDIDMELIMIGDGPEKSALEKQVQDGGFARKVHFLGRKDQVEVFLYLNSTDILVVPSRDEGRSLVIFEALACGKPVVASRVGGIPETLSDERLGILVESEDPVALAEGIRKAFTCLWDREYISNYAKRFTQSRLAPSILEIYDKVK